MTMTLDITSGAKPLTIPVPAKTAAKLKAQGVDAPESVTLNLEEASISDRRRFSERERLLQAQDKPEDFIAELMELRAAEGTDTRVLRALAEDMTPTAARRITQACMEGDLPNA